MTSTAHLIAVVEVDKDDRIICQAKGCGHSVYKRIHVVRDNDRITVIGSECFKRLYGDLEHVQQTPMFGSSEGRRLSREERATLLENTDRLITALENEHLEAEKERETQRKQAALEEAEKLRAIRSGHTGDRGLSALVNSGYRRGGPPAIDLLAGIPKAELAKIRIEAKILVQASNPGVDLDAPGWTGLVEAEVRKLVRQRRYG
jgi:hypothetical protein